MNRNRIRIWLMKISKILWICRSLINIRSYLKIRDSVIHPWRTAMVNINTTIHLWLHPTIRRQLLKCLDLLKNSLIWAPLYLLSTLILFSLDAIQIVLMSCRLLFSELKEHHMATVVSYSIYTFRTRTLTVLLNVIWKQLDPDKSDLIQISTVVVKYVYHY